MAGRALRKQLFAEIEARGGAEWLADYVAGGGTVLSLSEELGCSRTYLSRHLNAEPKYKAALEEARAELADQYAEEALSIADGLGDGETVASRERIMVAKERIDVRKWLAAVNSPRYQTARNGAQVNVNLNISQLHLDALRKRNAAPGDGAVDVTPEDDADGR